MIVLTITATIAGIASAIMLFVSGWLVNRPGSGEAWQAALALSVVVHVSAMFAFFVMGATQ